jgi:hypothetical protein
MAESHPTPPHPIPPHSDSPFHPLPFPCAYPFAHTPPWLAPPCARTSAAQIIVNSSRTLLRRTQRSVPCEDMPLRRRGWVRLGLALDLAQRQPLVVAVGEVPAHTVDVLCVVMGGPVIRGKAQFRVQEWARDMCRATPKRSVSAPPVNERSAARVVDLECAQIVVVGLARARCVRLRTRSRSSSPQRLGNGNTCCGL